MVEEALQPVAEAVIGAAKKVAAKTEFITVDHEHDFKVSWDGTHRQCADERCRYEEWNLACWTGGGWSPRRPEQLLDARRDLKKQGPAVNHLINTIPNFIRQADIIPVEVLGERISIIGAGAIGSFTMLGLVKMGFRNIHVWDNQAIGNENVGTQLYPSGRVGHSKVASLKEMMTGGILGPRAEHQLKIEAFNKNYKNEPLMGIVICAVDSMKARKMIWNAQKDNRRVQWFIDARMAAEQALLYTMKPTDDLDIASYEKTLYDDKEALQEPCTAAGTAYTALLISGFVCKAVKDVLTDSTAYPRISQWNIARNHQQTWYRPTDSDGNPIPFTKRPVKKKPKTPQIHAWSGVGKRNSEWTSLVALEKDEACGEYPFVVEWSGHNARHDNDPQRILIISKGDDFFLSNDKPRDGMIPSNDVWHEDAKESRFKFVGQTRGRAGNPRWRLLYADTILARGGTQEQADSVMPTGEPEPEPERCEEWRVLSACFEEQGSKHPFAVEWSGTGNPPTINETNPELHVFVRVEGANWLSSVASVCLGGAIAHGQFRYPEERTYFNGWNNEPKFRSRPKETKAARLAVADD